MRASREVRVRPPAALVALGVLGGVLLVLPFAALVAGVDVRRLPALLTSASALDALGLSLRTSLAATAACLVLGIPLALVLARLDLPGRSLARSLVLLPLVVPPVVGGIALTEAFGRRGLLGTHLHAAGIEIAFTTAAVVIAQAFVSLPFLVVALEGALRTRGEAHERTALSLGAGPVRTFCTVTLPLMGPGLLAGTVLAFARALGEFGATLTFAGSMQGTTRTLPLQVYLERETDPDAAVALSLVLVAVALVVITVAYGRSPGRAARGLSGRSPRFPSGRTGRTRRTPRTRRPGGRP
ncbi:molybdate ABC transporter permease subunit [Citricoccus sp. SGAir0253]|uniref:ABC transporter permease n=1 Tax=Citricoccus sp. SGAir0253 TaxID=2567881 RepID=UPI0011075F39|nr:ABC transporter permease [Citricoccus sp. SGAir0253]QCU77446.1 molybdate ABC transporter permease subunit [Citricoccus sp. SGAir0253]